MRNAVLAALSYLLLTGVPAYAQTAEKPTQSRPVAAAYDGVVAFTALAFLGLGALLYFLPSVVSVAMVWTTVGLLILVPANRGRVRVHPFDVVAAFARVIVQIHGVSANLSVCHGTVSTCVL